ncbi:MAG: PPC domain-containing protein [Bryobacteraceae bacterium]
MTRIAILFLASLASAAPPVLTSLEPWGAQRGKALTLTLKGQYLPEGAKIVSTLPAVFTPLASEAAGKTLPYLVEIKPDTPVGLYPVRIQSPGGISNILLFSVGTFPEMKEKEGNDSAETAQKLSQTPLIVNGTLKSADRDFYEVYGKAGEKRVFEIEARRMGSAIDPSLRIYDSAGKLLTRVEDTAGLGVDCRVEFTFPKEGTYKVEVREARFSDQASNFYRLKMGSYAYATAVYPLGWNRLKDVDVELSGGNLPAPVTVKPLDGMVHLPGSTASLPFPFVQSDLPEMLEPVNDARPRYLPANTVMNGRIRKAGEIDRYSFSVQEGKTYLVEAEARAGGVSQLDALLTVYGINGDRIESAGDKPPKQAVNAFIVAGDYSRDPYLVFEAPKGATQVTVAVEDLNGAGGAAHAYRLIAREQKPDFEVSLSTPYVNIPSGGTAIAVVNVERRGYNGDIRLTVKDLPKDIAVAGGTIPAEIPDIDTRQVSRRGVLTLTAKAGAPARTLDLTVIGEAKLEDGTRIERRALGPGMQTNIRGSFGFVDSSRRAIRPFEATWLGLALPAMVGTESNGVLEVKVPGRVRIIQGMRYDFPWTFVSKTPGMQLPSVVTPDTPGGRDLRISDGNKRQPGKGLMTMNTTIGTPTGTFDVILSTRTGMGMNDEVVYAPAITVDVVQGYDVGVPKQDGLKLFGTIRREDGFSAPVTITPDALPLGVVCPSVEVGENGTQYAIECQASKEAPVGEHMILLNAASILPQGEKGKVPYKIAPVEAKLRIGK